MNYPLQMYFKFGIGNRVQVTDSTGQLVMFVKQKLFRLKEAITIFSDEAQTQPLYTINANKRLDFSATYNFADAAGNSLGSIRRKGMRSLWKASYEVYDGEQHILNINEENGWVKVLDSLFSEIPIAGIFSGYVFNPSYSVTRLDGTQVLRIAKQPAFLEGRFLVEKKSELNDQEAIRGVLGVTMMLLLERLRG